MKKYDNQKGHPKCLHYLAAAIEVNGKYLLLRSAKANIFASEGYYFPGCLRDEEISPKRFLAFSLYLKYRLKVVVEYFIGDTVIDLGKNEFACLHLYKCRADNLVSMPVNIIEDFFSPSIMCKLPMSTADGYLAERLYIFDKAYTGKLRTVPLKKDESLKTILMYKSLLYFQNKVPNQDIVSFARLIKNDSSFDEITTAYNYIANRYKISLQAYLRETRTK